jgi:hypothetical protein
MTATKIVHSSGFWRLRPRERRTLLIIGDILMAGVALVISLYFWSIADPFLTFSLEFIRRAPAWFLAMPFFWPLLLTGLYEVHRAGDLDETLRGILVAAAIGLVIYTLIYFTSSPKSLPRRGVAMFIVSASILCFLWRMIYIKIFTAPRFMRRILLVGAGETGSIILKIIDELYPNPFILVGIIDDDPQKIGSEIYGNKVLGGSDCLLNAISENKITDLIVAISGYMYGSMFQALLDAQELGTEITRMPVAYEELLDRVPIRYLEADWILRSFVDQARINPFYELIKRLLDIIGGLIGVIILCIMLPFVALTIYMDSGNPIFYSQVRMGKGGQLYKILKFRTMRQDAEIDGQPQWAEENDVRATRVGKILRKTHLDEFPQFINVVRGEMSRLTPCRTTRTRRMVPAACTILSCPTDGKAWYNRLGTGKSGIRLNN